MLTTWLIWLGENEAGHHTAEPSSMVHADQHLLEHADLGLFCPVHMPLLQQILVCSSANHCDSDNRLVKDSRWIKGGHAGGLDVIFLTWPGSCPAPGEAGIGFLSIAHGARFFGDVDGPSRTIARHGFLSWPCSRCLLDILGCCTVSAMSAPESRHGDALRGLGLMLQCRVQPCRQTSASAIGPRSAGAPSSPPSIRTWCLGASRARASLTATLMIPPSL